MHYYLSKLIKSQMKRIPIGFFSDITDNSFTWKNVMISDDGTYTLDCEIHGKRVK